MVVFILRMHSPVHLCKNFRHARNNMYTKKVVICRNSLTCNVFVSHIFKVLSNELDVNMPVSWGYHWTVSTLYLCTSRWLLKSRKTFQLVRVLIIILWSSWYLTTSWKQTFFLICPEVFKKNYIFVGLIFIQLTLITLKSLHFKKLHIIAFAKYGNCSISQDTHKA